MIPASTVHEVLTALYEALDSGPGAIDLDWLLSCALGADTIGSTDELGTEEKRLYNAVRDLVIEAEWRIP